MAIEVVSMTGLILYGIWDYRVHLVAWRIGDSVLARRLMANGTSNTQTIRGMSFGRLLSDIGAYSGGFAILISGLSEAVALLGQPVERADSYPRASIHHCPQCRWDDCLDA